MQSDGRIESFEMCLLEPHGGELGGFVLLRGTEEQIEAVHRAEYFERITNKGSLVVDELGGRPGRHRRKPGALDGDLPGGTGGSQLAEPAAG
jgi:hypothetical protein